MTNLTEKIDELQTQLTTQHNAMMLLLSTMNDNTAGTITRLNTTNAILSFMRDNQLNRLSGIDTTNNILNDVHADTMSMDAKLLRLRNAIAPLGTNINAAANDDIYSFLAALVYAQYGVKNPTLTLAGGTTPTLIYQEQMQERYDAVMGVDADAGNSILWFISKIWGNIGSPGDLNSTVIALLSSLLYSSGQISSVGKPPQPGANGLCANPYISQNSITAAARNYVLWKTPIPTNYPYTISAGSSGVAGTQLNVAVGANMNGLNIYVFSRTAGVWRKGSSTNVYPTNQLAAVGGTTLEVSVESGQDAQVYLCLDGGTEAGPGMELFISAVSKLNRYANSYMFGVWGQGTSQITAQDGNVWTSMEGLRVFRPGNWLNYRVTNNSSAIFYIYDDVRANASPMMTIPAGVTQTIPRATTYIFAFRNTTTQPFEGAFGPPL